MLDGTTVDTLDYELVAEPERAQEILKSFKTTDKIAIDFETTALHPRDGYVRITTLWNDEHQYVFDHRYCGSFEKLAGMMVTPTLICYHIKFEKLWFAWFGYESVELWDVGLMRRAVQGGGGYSLGMAALWDLKIPIDKLLQTSDWGSDVLSGLQYNYAAFDGYVTWKLFKLWSRKMNKGHWRGFHIFNDSVMSILEMQACGMELDVVAHQVNINQWKMKRDLNERYVRRFTPYGVIANLNSNKQISGFLKKELSKESVRDWSVTPKSGHMVITQSLCRKAAEGMPYPMNRWMIALSQMRYYSKYLNTYGDKLITMQKMSGKISYSLNIAAALTGRMSSNSTNIQNIVRKPYVRRVFTTRPHNKEVMVLADYSGIEVRVLAEISGDERLLHDTIYGNVHATGAAIANGIDEGYFLEVLEDKDHKHNLRYKGYRQKAKVATFRLLYGAGKGAIAQSLNMTDDEAVEFVHGWAEKYPKAYNYRFQMLKTMTDTGYLPIVSGRTVYVRKADRGVPVAANYPVQGAAGDVMYAACYRVRNAIRAADIDCQMAATVHDEIIMYAAERDAEKALECLEAGMTQGWSDIFPRSNTDNLLESAIGQNWAAKP